MRSLPCWLKSDKVLIRLAALWLICALLFTVAWTTSYYLLPEGILRGKLLGQHIPIETSHVITTLVRIFGVNLLAGCGLVALANLFQVGDTSLGYQIVMFHAGLYGVLLGTNSFGIPAPARFAPSLNTVLSRSGAFEITAYIAIAAATRGLVIQRQRSWLDWHSEQVGSWREWRLNCAETTVIIGAILLLTAACYREAVQLHWMLGRATLERSVPLVTDFPTLLDTVLKFDVSTLPPVTFLHLLYLYSRANAGNDDGFG